MPPPQIALPTLVTARLELEPITVAHAEELWRLLRDPRLHTYVPLEPPTLKKQIERCERWAQKRSLSGGELSLNWLARRREDGRAVGHIQSSVYADGRASLGYLIAREAQRQGFATEALQMVLSFLRASRRVREVRAHIDSRNKASIRLALKLGLTEAGFVRETRHELVFARAL